MTFDFFCSTALVFRFREYSVGQKRIFYARNLLERLVANMEDGLDLDNIETRLDEALVEIRRAKIQCRLSAEKNRA